MCIWLIIPLLTVENCNVSCFRQAILVLWRFAGVIQHGSTSVTYLFRQIDPQ